ncbi:MAG: metallophosphoesterase, partial [Clostridiales bacterium]|nr:metallophosphoesterase [Clostridiales bacterium]
AHQRGAAVQQLLGDIPNQGKRSQHEALIDKLRRAEEEGAAVYVLPGNHDIGEVSAAEFAALYADFGYGEALSRDGESLSYSVLLGDILLLLLDTNGYSGHRDTAFLTDGTLGWMEGPLSRARDLGWQVLCAGHYPLLTSNSTPFSGKEKAVSLLESYGAPLYLCGHLHKRCVTLGESLTELVVDQAIAYPCCYALVDARDGGYRYEPQPVAVSEWAGEHGEADPNLLSFDAYQTQLEQARCAYVVAKLRGEQEISEQAQRQAEDFFFKLSDYRAHGTLSRYADMLREHPGCDILIQLGAGTIYSRWIPSVLADAVPYTTGFVLREGNIVTLDASQAQP